MFSASSTTSAPHGFYLTGSVRRPGFAQLGPNDRMTVYSAILHNGGFARFANLKRVYILRGTEDGTKARLPVNIVGIQKGSEPDLPLQPNDIVVVPEKFFSF